MPLPPVVFGLCGRGDSTPRRRPRGLAGRGASGPMSPTRRRRCRSRSGPAAARLTPMEKRVLLAVVLSFVVLYGYQALFPTPEPARRPNPAATRPAAPQAPAVSGQTAQVPPTAEAPAPADVAPAAEALVHDTAERDIVVDGPEVQAVFSTRGGVLKHWRLKRYLDSGQPLDLVPSVPTPGQPKPFSLSVGDPAIDATLSKALFKPSAESIDSRSPGRSLVRVQRRIRLDGAQGVRLHAGPPLRRRVLRVGDAGTAPPLNPTIHWGPALGTGVVSSGMTYAPSSQPIFYRDRKVTRVGFNDIQNYQSIEGRFGFAGVDDHYFLAAELSPPEPIRAAVRTGGGAGRRPGAGTAVRVVVGRRIRNRRSSGAVLLRTERFRRSGCDRSRPRARHRFRHVLAGSSSRCCAR